MAVSSSPFPDDLDAMATKTVLWANKALPRAIGSVASIVCRIDGEQLAIDASGLDLTPIADRLACPGDFRAARALCRALMSERPVTIAPPAGSVRNRHNERQ